MGLNGQAPPDGNNIVPLFSRAGTAEPPASPLSPFFAFAAALQNAFMTYNLGLLRMTTDCAKEIINTCAPSSEPPPRIIVADKGWLSDQAGYEPFLQNLETAGYHEIASYSAAISGDDDETLFPAKFVYWMNVLQDGNYVHIFHGDSEGRSGSLLELTWKEEAGAFAVAFYDIADKQPVKVEDQHIFDKTCGLLSDLVRAINHQNRQANSRLNSDAPLRRTGADYLHLVS